MKCQTNTRLLFLSALGRKALFVLFLIGFAAIGQESAKIEYKQIVRPRKLLPPDQKQYAMLIPEEMESKMLFSYNKNISSIEELKGENSIADVSMLGADKIFYDLANKKQLSLHKKGMLVSRNYAVEGDMDEAEESIKHTGNTVEILGYTCEEIEFEMDLAEVASGKVLVKAYYTKAIPYGHSPLGYMGLDGLLLKLETEFFSYEAVAVEVAEQHIRYELPADYKKISAEQFEDLMDEAMESLGQ